MNRKYKAKDKVAVIDRNGVIIRVISRVPYSNNGFDSYKYKGVIYPGYWNGAICVDSIQAFIRVTGD